MTDYREILRLRSLGVNNKQIAESMGIARQTVIKTLQTAFAQELDWQSVEPLSDKELAIKLFPQEGGKPTYKMPDYDYIHREMAKLGMTQQLLWFEYCDECRAAGETPYQLIDGKDSMHKRKGLAKDK